MRHNSLERIGQDRMESRVALGSFDPSGHLPGRHVVVSSIGLRQQPLRQFVAEQFSVIPPPKKTVDLPILATMNPQRQKPTWKTSP